MRSRGGFSSSSAVSLLAAALALASAWHSGGAVWRQLELEHTIYGGYSDIQRERAPVADVPLPTGAFDFFAAHVRRGDRIYFQVTPAGFSEFFDLPEIISGAGRFYLLPAVQVKDLGDATVVVSWGEDPSHLQLHYVSQVRFGLLPIYVSRLSGR